MNKGIFIVDLLRVHWENELNNIMDLNTHNKAAKYYRRRYKKTGEDVDQLSLIIYSNENPESTSKGVLKIDNGAISIKESFRKMFDI